MIVLEHIFFAKDNIYKRKKLIKQLLFLILIIHFTASFLILDSIFNKLINLLFAMLFINKISYWRVYTKSPYIRIDEGRLTVYTVNKINELFTDKYVYMLNDINSYEVRDNSLIINISGFSVIETFNFIPKTLIYLARYNENTRKEIDEKNENIKREVKIDLSLMEDEEIEKLKETMKNIK